jgi:hypothetical protein
VCGGGWSRCSWWSIDNGDSVVGFGRIFDVGVVCGKSVRVVAVFLLLLTLGLLFLVQFSLILLVLADTRGVSIPAIAMEAEVLSDYFTSRESRMLTLSRSPGTRTMLHNIFAHELTA